MAGSGAEGKEVTIVVMHQIQIVVGFLYANLFRQAVRRYYALPGGVLNGLCGYRQLQQQEYQQ